MLTKGIKTSELWVVLILLVSQYLEFRGVDTSLIREGVGTAQEQVAALAKELQEQYGSAGINTTWVAMAYVVGRTMLKWREIGKGK